jgi:hypothetical protein
MEYLRLQSPTNRRRTARSDVSVSTFNWDGEYIYHFVRLVSDLIAHRSVRLQRLLSRVPQFISHRLRLMHTRPKDIEKEHFDLRWYGRHFDSICKTRLDCRKFAISLTMRQDNREKNVSKRRDPLDIVLSSAWRGQDLFASTPCTCLVRSSLRKRA